MSRHLRLAGLGLSLLIGGTASADTVLKRFDLDSYDAFIDVPQSWSYARYRPNFETLGHVFSDPKGGRTRLRIIIAPANVIDSKFLGQSATRSCVHGLVHFRSHDRGNAVEIVVGIDDDADAMASYRADDREARSAMRTVFRLHDNVKCEGPKGATPLPTATSSNAG